MHKLIQDYSKLCENLNKRQSHLDSVLAGSYKELNELQNLIASKQEPHHGAKIAIDYSGPVFDPSQSFRVFKINCYKYSIQVGKQRPFS